MTGGLPGRVASGARARTLAGLLALACATGAVYAGSLHNGFVNWDDDLHITANPAVAQPSLRTLFTVPPNHIFHPLAVLSWALEYRLVGASPFLYHLDDLLLHLLNTALLVTVLRRLFRAEPGAAALPWLAGGVFALHPLQVEVVAWATARKDLLCIACYAGAWLAYEAARERGSRVAWALALLGFAAALLAKPMAMSLPAVLLLGDLWRGRRPGPSLLAVLPFAGVALAVGLSVPLTQPAPADSSHLPIYQMGLDQRLWLAARGLAFYLAKLFWPSELSVFYDIRLWRVAPRQGVLAGAALGGIAVWLWRHPEQRRLGLWAALFFALTWAPVSKVVPFSGNSPVNDRYLYLPIVGLAALFGLPLASACARGGVARGLALAACAGAALLMAAASSQRSLVWRSSETLWSDVLAHYPGTALAHHKLGVHHLKQTGDVDRALGAFEAAVAADPGFSPGWLRLGEVRARRGEPGPSARAFERAVATAPNDPHTRAVVAGFYLERGAVEAAIRHLEAAVLISPVFARAHSNLGVAYLRLGRLEPARAALERARGLEPGEPRIHASLGDVLRRLGDEAGARAAYAEAARLRDLR